MIRTGRIVAVWIGVALSGCAVSRGGMPSSAPAGSEAQNLTRWIAEHPFSPDINIGVVELGSTGTSSFHIVHVRDRERMHVHQHHDLVAVLQQGHGTLQFQSKRLHMTVGSVVAIPRGTPHAFINESRQPAEILVVFSPPFDIMDTVLIDEAP